MKERESIPQPDAPKSPQRQREMTTRKSVKFADKMADTVITYGGLFVIIAVVGIMVFLFSVAVPLFLGETPEKSANYGVAAAGKEIFSVELDEHKTIAVMVTADGALTPVHLPTGNPLEKTQIDLGGNKATAFARTLSGGHIALGFADGTVRFGQINLRTTVLPANRLPKGLKTLDDRDFTDGRSVYSKIPGDQIRRVWIETNLAKPQQVAPKGMAIINLGYKVGGTPERPSRAFATVDKSGVARLSLTESQVNLLTGETESTVTSVILPNLPKNQKIVDILLTEKADLVYVGEEGGQVFRFDTRDFNAVSMMEKRDILPGTIKLTSMDFLLGEESIIAGGSDGSVNIFFRVRQPDATTTDGLVLVKAHQLEPHSGPSVAFSSSQRSRMFATADNAGNVWLRHATSNQTLLRFKTPRSDSVGTLRLSPRDNAIVSVSPGGKTNYWSFSAEHPETTFKTLFGKIWYEGYPESSFTWQSSSGDDAFEEKISLIPLIFGTIKGTVYSLIFAIPVAILGAIFTSEFVDARIRMILKPAMEMMASLPSVVLGFIAALILAPFVETWIAAVILAFLLVPGLLLLGAYLWQILPPPIALPLAGMPRFFLMIFVVLFGSWLAFIIGPTFERYFFGGDFKAWVNGDIEFATPFLFLILFPLSFMAILLASDRMFTQEWKQKLKRIPHIQAASLEFARWMGVVIVSLLVSWVVASILAWIGVDARGGVVDTYVQRNSLVVGFAMGFAVIPIIYTIAEDSLHAVPEHLRAASLGCGATAWQTALWIVLPTAASGIFAAVMVGMGRAVGETMIVVMAAGNTPVLDWNIFSGLRALSANIAVELPEAVKDGTLYRVLFLAALVLFGMTFIVNTVAELVRLRFRKRAAQL